MLTYCVFAVELKAPKTKTRHTVHETQPSGDEHGLVPLQRRRVPWTFFLSKPQEQVRYKKREKGMKHITHREKRKNELPERAATLKVWPSLWGDMVSYPSYGFFWQRRAIHAYSKSFLPTPNPLRRLIGKKQDGQNARTFTGARTRNAISVMTPHRRGHQNGEMRSTKYKREIDQVSRWQNWRAACSGITLV